MAKYSWWHESWPWIWLYGLMAWCSNRTHPSNRQKRELSLIKTGSTNNSSSPHFWKAHSWIFVSDSDSISCSIIRQMVITISRMATDEKYHVNGMSIITNECTFCPVYLKKNTIQCNSKVILWIMGRYEIWTVDIFLIFCSADERQQWCGRNSLDGGVSGQLTISSSELAFYYIW